MSKSHTKITQQEQGYIVLITVLILGAVVTIITALLLITGENASISSNSVVANASAKAAANGCAQLALAAITANTNMATPVSGNQTVSTTTNTTCTYTITGTSPNYTIAATGTVTQSGGKTYIRRVTITTNQVTPQISISSWQDTP